VIQKFDSHLSGSNHCCNNGKSEHDFLGV